MGFVYLTFVTEAIIFFSMGLFIYWCTRLFQILLRSEEEVNEILDNDLRWGRMVWMNLQLLFAPRSQFIAL